LFTCLFIPIVTFCVVNVLTFLLLTLQSQ
jgi:hypothetical protein